MTDLAAPERLPADQVTVSLRTKADRIRALANAGYLRTEIAILLDIRYQHVRQVLERSGIIAGRTNASAPAARLPAAENRSPSHPAAATPFPASRLIEAGFVRIGQWNLVSDGAFVLDSIAPTDAGVYAFVVDGTVVYVGVTQGGLRRRMGHYVRGHERQRTSSRVKRLILEALGAGSVVEVLLATPGGTAWNGLPVVTAPGLEAGLIRLIRPIWNMNGVGQR
ncbi:MAG TPA: GIY-YIG nuclease family protein [Allosphingosinicella sp.]|nr:GIY-YIG nuclease family protein [Allosphingosinicella sp.]